MIETEIEGRERTVEEIAELLVMTGDALITATLYASPRHTPMRTWMHEPRLGDLVMVNFAGFNTPAIQRVGYWVAAWTFIHPAEEGFEDVYETFRDHAREEIWMIELLNGDLLNWTNCELKRLPRNEDERRELTR